MSILGNKDFTLRIFKPNGVFIKTLVSFSWQTIKFQTNGGCGQFVFALPNKFDDFGEGSVISAGNRVELWSTDIDTQPTGTLIYSGWIDTYSSKIAGQVQEVQVTCFGWVTLAKKGLLTDLTNVLWATTPGTPYLQAGVVIGGSANIVAIAQKALTLFNAYQTYSPITYTATSMDTISVTLSYLFDKVMITDLLNTVVSQLPAGSYWYIGADNVLQIRLKPTKPTHTFTFGKTFSEVDPLTTADHVANNIIIETNNVTGVGLKNLSYYHDAVSFPYLLWNVQTNSTFVQQSDIDTYGNTQLAATKGVQRKHSIIVIDKSISENYGLEGYAIEKIRPGDTCKIRGFNDITSQSFPDNLQIVGIERTPYTVKLELESLQDSIARQLAAALQTSNNNGSSTQLTTIGSSTPNPTRGTTAFTSTITSGATNTLSSSGIVALIFGTVTAGTNLGSYYSASTGIFTAPIAGWYQFMTRLGFVDGLAAGNNVGIFINTTGGDDGGTLWTHTGGFRNRLFYSRLVRLAAGDQIRVSCFYDNPTATNLASGEFTGILISPT